MMSALFLIKQILGSLLMPLPLVLFALFLSGILWMRNYLSVAKILICGSLLTLYLLSLPFVARPIASYLEFQSPKYSNQKVDYVLVLGGYHVSDERKPITSLLSRTSLMRLIEGVRIYRLNPGSKLLLSGYKGQDEISNAEAMSQVAAFFNVPLDDIVLAENVKDTAEESVFWTGYVFEKSMIKHSGVPASIIESVDDTKAQPFLKYLAVVTSASHMPRALFLFEQAFSAQKMTNMGRIEIVAAPTAYMTGGHHPLSWHDFIPSAQALEVVEISWHEYLGLMWAAR